MATKGKPDIYVDAPEDVLPMLRAMLYELEHNRLVVSVVPAPEPMHSGHRIRVVDNQNPWWYSELCSRYLRGPRPGLKRRGHTKPDTRRNRHHVLNAMRNFVKNGRSKAQYADDLVELAYAVQEGMEIEREQYEADKRLVELREKLGLGGSSTTPKADTPF